MNVTLTFLNSSYLKLNTSSQFGLISCCSLIGYAKQPAESDMIKSENCVTHELAKASEREIVFVKSQPYVADPHSSNSCIGRSFTTESKVTASTGSGYMNFP